MSTKTNFDVIIVGGSFAGLSAAMTLGRSLFQVLIIDSGKPCNRQTPHSHNFITQDGETPKAIADKARAQVLKYDTVALHNGLATKGIRTEKGFEIHTQSGEIFTAKKLLFATGVADQMPAIEGFAECWGITAIHCPYCHGYEVRHQPLGIISNGDMALEFCRLIFNWSKKITLLTNGPSTLSAEQVEKLKSHSIDIIEKEIVAFEHTNGKLEAVRFKDNSRQEFPAVFARAKFIQHCLIPEAMGCELNEHGHLKVDAFYKTSVPGVFAAGDNTTMMRSVSLATAGGTMAGVVISKELIEEGF